MPERMELLAPAGDWDALVAAVQNGADAIYLGAGAFNARRNAANFSGDALDRAVAYCHVHGVNVHVTLNTLVREDELDALAEAVRAVNESGADAVIVQDFGTARALRRMAPQIALHASTQMAVHNRQGVAFLKENGFDRAVLARECTFEDMADCAGQGIEIETFVHGALCVACSGQCLMSSLVGGRSGNRGLCAQPCRLPWRLDGQEGYLLSTKDLCGLGDLARLRDAGVSSLKIEGRMKRAEYVAVTVAAYRRALDALYEGRDIDLEDMRAELAQMFNRGGFTRGYGAGMAESELMYPERPNHVGVRVGRCPKGGEVALDADIENADALALRRDGADDVPVKLAGQAGEKVRCPVAKPGDALYRLVSAAQMKRAHESVEGERRAIPVDMRATLRVGQPARLAVTDGEHTVEITGDSIEAAQNRGFDEARAVAQLGKTGGTPFAARAIKLDADANAFCPASLLNGLRRDALAALETKRTEVARTTHPMRRETIPPREAEKPLLYAEAGDIPTLKRALDSGADILVLAPRDVRPEALEALDLSPFAGRLALAVPAVLTAGALDGLSAWANRQPFGMTFLSNVGQLGMAWPGRRVGDFLLNAANNLTVAQLKDWKLDGCTPSVELTAGQAAALGGEKHLVVWGRLPLMHLRHCPLRAAKGMPGRHADCRRCDGCAPDERLDGRALVDRKNAAFPLRRVAMTGGCVVQVLNSVPLMPLKHLGKLPKAAGWRLLLDEAEPVEAVVRVYRAALGGADFKALPEWKALENLAATTGHYFRGVE